MLDGLDDPDGRLVGGGPANRPAGADGGHSQGEAEVPRGVAPFVARQVDLDETEGGVVALRPGADEDLGLEQRVWFDVAPPSIPGEHLGPRRVPVDGGRTHGYEESGLLVGEVHLAVVVEQGDEDWEPFLCWIASFSVPAGRAPIESSMVLV